MLSLLFIRNALKDQKNRPESKSDSMIVGTVMTPLGNFSGIRQSDMELKQMPFVDETGNVGIVPMKQMYLNYVLLELAKRINVGKMLLDGSREFIIIADIDTLELKECCPCYYATTKNVDDMESLQHLESNVLYCLDNKMNALPLNIKTDWLKNFITPLLNDVKSKIKPS